MASSKQLEKYHTLHFFVGLISFCSWIVFDMFSQRFLPIDVATKAGTMTFNIMDKSIYYFQLMQGILAISAALFFLGRNTFCVSKNVLVHENPAHHL